MYHHILEMMNSPAHRQARLLDSGATMRPREASSDDERSDDEEAGIPRGHWDEQNPSCKVMPYKLGLPSGND